MDTINFQPNLINDDKQRIVEEFKLFLSLKPSDKIFIEQIPCKRNNNNNNAVCIENVHIMALACCIGDDNFIIFDDKIIHINCYRLRLFNKDLILSYKNSQSIGLTYDEACLMAEKLIMEQNICTVPIKEDLDFQSDGHIMPRDKNSKYNKKNISVVMFIGSNNTPFNWLNFTWYHFRIIKKVMYEGIEILLPIRVGYYNRDKDCNINDDKPFFDYHEEMTRHEDDKCLLLYASLVYKSE